MNRKEPIAVEKRKNKELETMDKGLEDTGLKLWVFRKSVLSFSSVDQTPGLWLFQAMAVDIVFQEFAVWLVQTW